jgi:hypothetical protein
MKATVLGAIALSSLFASTAARAQSLVDPTAGSAFGGTGQVSIAGDFAIDFEHASGNSVLKLAPAVDYFIAPQLSLGAQIAFAYTGNDAVSNTAIGFGPRVGYNVPQAPMFSLFPRAGFAFTHVSFTQKSPSGDLTASANLLSIFLFAPFLFHPVPHFYLGIGPSLDADIAGGNSAQREVTIGLHSTVGGYFDW